VLKGSSQDPVRPADVGGLNTTSAPGVPADFGGNLSATMAARTTVEFHGELGDTIGSTGYILNGRPGRNRTATRDNMHFEVGDLNLKVVSKLTTAGRDAARQLLRRELAGDLHRPDARRVAGRPARQPVRERLHVRDPLGHVGHASIRDEQRDDVHHQRVLHVLQSRLVAAVEQFGGSARTTRAIRVRGMANLDTSCGNEGRLRNTGPPASSRASR